MSNISYTRIIAYSLITFAPPLSLAVDDSTWINQGINSALAQGQQEFVLPSGTLTLENPIIIPAGAKNFTLRGSGPNSTVLTTPTSTLVQAIKVGVVTMLHNNSGITNRPNFPVLPIASGSSVIKLKNNTPSFQTGYYVLWDQNVVLRVSGDGGSMNHAELVKVIGYDASTSTAILEQPVGREFSLNASLADFRDVACQNISVTDLGFDGTGPSGTYTTSFVSTGVVDGLYLSRLRARNYVTNAVTTNIGKNVRIEDLDIGGATAGLAGQGYGLGIYRSRFVSVENCRDEGSRHGFIVHSGSMDVTFENCVSYSGGFDTHGYDERRISFSKCSGAGVNIGNNAYLAGGQDISVNDCDFSSWYVSIGPNTRNVFIKGSSFLGISIYNVKPGTNKGIPSGGYADNVLFDRCVIRGGDGNGLMRDSEVAGTVTFTNCYFDCNRDLTHLWRATSWTQATFNFVNCVFNTTGGGKVFELKSPGPRFQLNVYNCQFQNQSNEQWVPYFVEVANTFGGRAVFKGNNYYMKANPNASFIYDPFKRLKGAVIGNKAMPATKLK